MGPAETSGYPCLPTNTAGGDAPKTEPFFGIFELMDSIVANLSSIGHFGRPQSFFPLHSIHRLLDFNVDPGHLPVHHIGCSNQLQVRFYRASLIFVQVYRHGTYPLFFLL